MGRAGNVSRLRLWWFSLVLLGAVAACASPPAPIPPPQPSELTTKDGYVYFVTGLRMPGTSQDLRLQQDGAKTWIPLSLVQEVRFTGPTRDRYRPAVIILTSGEQVKGDLFVDFLLAGTTDLGYWNIRMDQVERLVRGYE